MPDLAILDVGHGNCAVLHGKAGTVVIDAAPGETLLEFLEQRGIVRIAAVLISHADQDHMAGAITLLTQPWITVDAVHLNSEPLREGTLWTAFRVALHDARTRTATNIQVQLTTATSIELPGDDVRLEVLHPTPEVAASGAGGQDLKGRRLTPNSMSAVIRVVHQGRPRALFAGDLDSVGLDNLLDEVATPEAEMLIFPHHGGRPGQGDPRAFAARFCAAVKPSVVFFSLGRGKHGTPLPQVVEGVRVSVPKSHIACTQLSQRCAATLPSQVPSHLGNRPARGRAANACCIGSVVVGLERASGGYAPSLKAHRAFVNKSAPTALCEGRAG
mgnify:CR=1 FL=1